MVRRFSKPKCCLISTFANILTLNHIFYTGIYIYQFSIRPHTKLWSRPQTYQIDQIYTIRKSKQHHSCFSAIQQLSNHRQCCVNQNFRPQSATLNWQAMTTIYNLTHFLQPIFISPMWRRRWSYNHTKACSICISHT